MSRGYGDAAVLVEVHGGDYEQRWAAAQTLGTELRAELPGAVDVSPPTSTCSWASIRGG